MIHALRPAAFAGDAVLDHDALREHEDEGQRRSCHGTAHTVRCDGEDHTVLGAGRHVDGIVAHTEAGDQLQTAIRTGYGLARDPGQHDCQRVVLRRGCRRQLGFDLGQKFIIDARVLQNLERGFVEDRSAVGFDVVPGNADTKLALSHFVPPGCAGLVESLEPVTEHLLLFCLCRRLQRVERRHALLQCALQQHRIDAYRK